LVASAEAPALSGRFRIVDDGRTVCIVRRGYEEALSDLLMLPPARLAASAPGPIRRFRGRGMPVSFALPAQSGERAFVRTYRRGGLLRHVLPDWFLGRARPLRELQAIEHALAQGVATAPVLALHGERRFLGFYSWRIALLEIPDARDLESYFLAHPSRDEARQVIRKAARAIAALHSAGLCHADLHLKNLLLAGNGNGQVLVVDLDKATRCDPLPPVAAQANLLRLDRSVEKLKRHGGCVSRADRLRFLRDYAEGALPERSSLRRLLRRRERGLRFHGIAWRLSSLLGRGPLVRQVGSDA
jgi:tRNA A-37 threonylcarbamoyl transferase component Bud32